KILFGKSRGVGCEPRSLLGRDRADQGRQTTGRSQDLAGDGWLRVLRARRAGPPHAPAPPQPASSRSPSPPPSSDPHRPSPTPLTSTPPSRPSTQTRE